LHSTWVSIGVFGQLEGSKADTVEKALKVMQQNIEKITDDASDLAWCLECVYAAGIPKENPLVKRYIKELSSLQHENGAWKSDDVEEHTVSTPINVLNMLKRYGVW